MSVVRGLVAAAVLSLGHGASAQVTNSTMAIADAFVCTGSANYESGADLTGLNFGGAGALAVAPASSAKGEFQSVIGFNLSNSVAVFDSVCGSRNWRVTGMALELSSNYGVAGVQPNNPLFNVISGGQFVIEWLADAAWVEGTGTPNLPTTDGISYSGLPVLLAQAREALCTNTYAPPGNNVHVTWPLPLTTNLVGGVHGGGDVNFRFYAADQQVGYLFNSHSYGRGNEPLMVVTAAEKPPVILWGGFTNGVFRLSGIGGAGLEYQVQTNSSLGTTNWQAMGTAAADGSGRIQFDDGTATSGRQRFYRLAR